MMRCALVFLLVAFAFAEDCFDYSQTLEDGKKLSEVQNTCLEKTKEDRSKYPDCIECTLGFINAETKTVNYDRMTESLSKYVVNEKFKTELLNSVTECKKKFEGKYDEYLKCWRDDLMKTCESDPGVNLPAS